MAQQNINIGAAPNDGSGDNPRVAFKKCNDNFTELYTSGAGSSTEGIWNYNQNSTDTSTSPTSGRFRTNSGDAANATQIAIHGISINGIDRANTLRTQVAGDIIKCQDASDSDTWARYVLQSTPVDNGTWFQLNVAFNGGGGTPPGNNQEIIFAFAASGGGTAAPVGAEYITSTANATLTSERVLTDTATITWDRTTAGQIKANAAGGGGNVSNSGTPTSGQYAKWVTATTIQGVAAATVLSDIGAAPLNAPVFTGDARAVTPTAGDNDTSIATTAFVTAAVAAIAPFGPPQGRLTLQTLTPVMTTTQSAKTTIFYPPYQGNLCPIYDGTTFSMLAFTELSAITTDTTKSPAVIGDSKVNDWFVWNDVGTLRISHGPDWTNDTTRSAGTALVMVKGIWLNNASITNGPAAQRGTYVGTTRSNATSTFDMIFNPAAAPGGVAGVMLGVYNAYNRVRTISVNRESTNSYSVPAGWRNANGSGDNSIGFVDGLAESIVDAMWWTGPVSSQTSGEGTVLGLHLDWVSGNPEFQAFGCYGYSLRIQAGVSVTGRFLPVLGFHVVNAVEYSNVGGTSFHGASAPQAGFQAQGIQVEMWM
jgi:hypothetical protein